MPREVIPYSLNLLPLGEKKGYGDFNPGSGNEKTAENGL